MKYHILDPAGEHVLKSLAAGGEPKWTAKLDLAMRFPTAREAYAWAEYGHKLEHARVVREDSVRLFGLK